MDIKPTVWIGKKGLNETQITEIKDQLSRKKLIKIKFLKSALDNLSRKELADEIEKSSGGIIVGMTGLAVTIAKDKITVLKYKQGIFKPGEKDVR